MNLKECYEKVRATVPKNSYVRVTYGFFNSMEDLDVEAEVSISVQFKDPYVSTYGSGVTVLEAYNDWVANRAKLERMRESRDRAMQEIT